MPRSGRSSFRRMLLLQIMLFSIPILLVGETVAIRKARDSLLETARQNMVESAARKAGELEREIRALQNNLLTAAESGVLKEGSSEEALEFIQELQARLPTRVSCMQLLKPKPDGQGSAIAASTCSNEVLNFNPALTFVESRQPPPPRPPAAPTAKPRSPKADVRILSAGRLPSETDLSAVEDLENSPNSPGFFIAPGTDASPESEFRQADDFGRYTKLDLVLELPVYQAEQQPRYRLKLHTVFFQAEQTAPRSLLGSTIVIAEDGTILTHPNPKWIGKNVSQTGVDSSTLSKILPNARAGNSRPIYLRNIYRRQEEWLAGYSAATVEVSEGDYQTWTVLALTPTERALYGLRDIQRVMLVLTIGMMGAYAFSAIYVAQYLSGPIEALGSYARRIRDLSVSAPVPKDFRIRELNHLASTLEGMMKRLEEHAQELKAARREAEIANQLKSEFLATTSHELRTPLNAIIGCIRLVKDGCCDDPEEEQEFLQRADDAAIHLLKIINDILDLARIEAGALSLKLESVDLQQLLSEVVDLQTIQAQQKGLQLLYHQPTEAPILQVDRAKLKQVLLNVIYNAIKFTEQGGITVRAEICSAADLPPAIATSLAQSEVSSAASVDAWIVISVADTGIGIDPKQQHKLFRPFVMVDGSTTRKFEGTGLGLAISKNLMHLMGGDILLNSAGVNQGTTVQIVLPLAYPLPTSEADNGTTDRTSADPALEVDRLASLIQRER